MRLRCPFEPCKFEGDFRELFLHLLERTILKETLAGKIVELIAEKQEEIINAKSNN